MTDTAPGKNTTNSTSAGMKVLRLLTALVILGVTISVVTLIYIGEQNKVNRLASLMREKSVVADEMVNEVFEPVSIILNTINGWVESGELALNRKTPLSQTIIPILDNTALDEISGITIADTNGKAYYLYRENDKWISRFSESGEKEATAWFQRIADNRVEKEWTEKTSYDPRFRPWFLNVLQDTTPAGDILWTKPYFFQTLKQPGITASLKSFPEEREDTPLIIACDLLITQVQTKIKGIVPGNEGSIFLLSRSGRFSNLTPIAFFDLDPVSGKVEKQKVHSISEETRTAFTEKIYALPSDKHLIFHFMKGKERWWGSITPDRNVGDSVLWCIAVPESDLGRDTKNKGYHLFIIAFTAIVICVFILLWVAVRSRQRLELLSNGTSYVNATGEQILDLIRAGETDKTEFKSTLRWNIKAGKAGKEIELASMKTLSAFMNTDGGTLLIGVEDSGDILGLDADDFKNDDKALLHLNNLIAQHIGLEFSRFISFDLKTVNDKKIFVIDCSPSEEPVFLKNKESEEFYIRVGPGSRKLSMSEVIEYLKKRTT